MRALVPLAVVYLLVAALLVPGSPLAAQEQQPAGAPAQAEQAEPAPAAPAEPAEEEPAEEPSAEGAAPGAQAPDTQAPGDSAATPSGDSTVQPPAAPTQAPAADQAAVSKGSAPADVTRRKRRAPRARAAATGRVTIRDFAYDPVTISVDVGDSVTWTNRDSADHTATGQDFDTGVLSGGQSGSFTFREEGDFAYLCSIHPNMKGTVRVAAAETQEPAPQTEGSGAQGDDDGDDEGESSPSTSSGGTSLPRSGAEEAWLAAIGLLLLGAGLVLRRGPARG